MKVLFKIVTAPIVWIADLFTFLCMGLISCTGIVFRVASGILTLLGLAVLFAYSVTNGLILLTLALLLAGLPLVAVKLLGGLQRITGMLRGI